MAKDIKFDLKRFKHIKSDDKSTTLQHPEGHTITLAHSALSKDAQAQLKALAAGTKDQTDKRKMYASGSKEGPVSEDDSSPKVADIFKAFKPGDSEDTAYKTENPDFVPPKMSEEDPQTSIEAPKMAADSPIDMSQGIKVDDPNDERPFWLRQAHAQVADPTQLPYDQMQQRLAEQQQQAPPPTPAQQPQQPGLGGVADEVATAQQQQPQQPLPQSPYDQILSGKSDLARAEMAQAADVQKEKIEQARAKQEAINLYESKYKAIDDEHKELMEEVKSGQVDPNKFWDNHSRIANAIGILVAGFNPTSSPNAAIQFLQKQMDMDLQAQTKNLDSKNNLVAMNMKRFQSLQDATLATRAMQNDLMALKLEQAAAKSTNPIIQAKLKQDVGAFRITAQQQMQELAAKQLKADMVRLAAGARNNPKQAESLLATMDIVDPERSKALRSTLVPGVGFANTPEDAKHLKEVQDRKLMIDDNVAKAIKMVKSKGTYEALGPHNAVLDGLADQIATDMAKLQDPNSVARPAEVELVKKSLIESGLSTRNKTAIDTLKAFNKTVEDRYSKAFTTRGMTPPGKKEGVSDIEEGTRGTFQGKSVIRKNGKWVLDTK